MGDYLWFFVNVRLVPNPKPARSILGALETTCASLRHHLFILWNYARKSRVPEVSVYMDNHGLGRLVIFFFYIVRYFCHTYSYWRKPGFSDQVKTATMMVFKTIEEARKALRYDWSEDGYYQYVVLEGIKEGKAYQFRRPKEIYKWDEPLSQYILKDDAELKQLYGRHNCVYTLANVA